MLRMRVRSHGGTSRSDLSLAEPSLLRQRSFFGTRLPRRPQTHFPPLRRRCPATLQTRDTTLATAAVGHSKIFGAPMEKTSYHAIFSGRPFAIILTASIAVIAICATLGWNLGCRLPGALQSWGRYICCAVGFLFGSVLSKVSLEMHEEAARVDVHNAIISQDPTTLDGSLVQEMSRRYGLNLVKRLSPQLCAFYDRYLESCIPKGEASLTGKEASKLVAFKSALGISDEDAALVHMDVGRRLSRSTFESDTRTERSTSRKAFQSWIYLSYLVFGERKAAFLLPLRRVFGLSQAQISVAIRENAKAVFRQKMEEMGRGLQMDRAFLEKLRQTQLSSQLSDDVASEVVMDIAKKKVENDLRDALNSIRDRSTSKDLGLPMHKMTEVLEFNQDMASFAAENSESLPPGLGKITIHGGAFEKATSSADQRELFQLFLEEKLVSLEGQFTIKLRKELDELMFVLGLGPKEAERVTNEVCSKVYRRLLREEVTSGRLDAAESKAAVLQRLCDRIQFRPELAAAMHKGIYRQKMEASLQENGKITDEDEKELQRIRTLMCIPDSDVLDVMRSTVGSKFRSALDEALSVKYDAFGQRERNIVLTAIKELRINKDMAKEMLAVSTKNLFLQYITASRLKQNRLDAAKELKRMVFFSNIVIAPLLEDIKGAQVDLTETMKQFSETLAKASKEVEDEGDKPLPTAAEEVAAQPEGSTPSTLSKATKAKEVFETEGDKEVSSGVRMSSQKEITLRDELDLRDRSDIYRNYLLYCLSGDVISMPMGSVVMLERDNDEFGRLSQLGDILGLTPVDVMKIHTDFAEQAFRQQVKAVLDDGPLTKEKTEALTEMQDKMGLSAEQGQKIIKGVQNERMASSLQSAKAMGDLSIQKLLDMKDTGVEIESFTSQEFRRRLYEQEAERIMSDGKGDFDESYLFTRLPTSLGIDAVKARASVEDVAKGKQKLQVVQAMSDLRMKKADALVADVNNLLVCSKILMGSSNNNKTENGNGIWDRRDEVLDLFAVYFWKTRDEEMAKDLQSVLKIDEKEASALKASIEDGSFRFVEEVKDEEVFF